ncbi:putative reverse transcriptase domain-containing protein [Tanacetum coccineum]
MPADFTRLHPTTGRVYATTRDQAAKTSGTITSILYIDDRTVFVLFDTGATHSIISTTFAKKLNMTPTPLIERVIISTPMKNHMLIDHEYVNCPLRFDDRVRPANLLPIHMFDFDVILGMDWLASHRATIDCYVRTVIFGNVCQPEFIYHGSSPLKSVKLISAMKARTLISHGCQGFLASVMDTSLESPNIENLSVVREFADVFPDELPGLPPAREIEFGIELIPGAEPISKAPYRMAPVELKELKEQLQEELLENDFIRTQYYDLLRVIELRAGISKTAFRYALWPLRILDGIIMESIKGLKLSPNGETDYLQIKEAKGMTVSCGYCADLLKDGKHTEFRVDDEGVVWFEDRLCVPNDQTLREKIMTEAHSSPFTIHPGSTKMYKDLKQYFWWNGMKQDVATFVSKCMTCQQYCVKMETSDELKWKSLDCWYSCFFVSTRDPKFTSHFWKGLQKAWGTRLKFSTAFHPQTDGQSERTIQTLEDMLRACALDTMDRENVGAPICWDEVFAIQRMLNVFGSRAAQSLDSSVHLKFWNVLRGFRIVFGASSAVYSQFTMSFMYPLFEGITIIIHCMSHLIFDKISADLSLSRIESIQDSQEESHE